MKRVREHLPIAAVGSLLWWFMEQFMDKGIGHIMGGVIQLLAHLQV